MVSPMERESTPVVAGLAVGIAFVVLFSIFLMPKSPKVLAEIESHGSTAENKKILKLFAIVSDLHLVKDATQRYGGTVAGSIDNDPEVLAQFLPYSNVDSAVQLTITKKSLHSDTTSRGVQITIGFDSRDRVVAIYQKCIGSDIYKDDKDIGEISATTINCI